MHTTSQRHAKMGFFVQHYCVCPLTTGFVLECLQKMNSKKEGSSENEKA